MNAIPEVSFGLTLAFVALVGWAVVAAVFLLRTSGALTRALPLGLGVVIWLAVPAIIASTGLLTEFAAIPPRVPLLLLPIATLTVVLACTRLGNTVGANLALGTIIGVQAFRIPLEVVLHQLHGEGALPVQMTYAGANFDVASGVGALLLWAWSKRAPIPVALAWIWAVGGLILLCTIVTIALLSFPQPFGFFEPANRIVATFPWIWLPTVHVQLALFGHVVVLRVLWKGRSQRS